MRNIFRMDIHRLLHSKVLYVSLIFLTIMSISQVISNGDQASLDLLLGASTSSGSDDFLSASMGAGVIYILLGIILTLFVCRDYSSGFAKNIFTVHANPWNYIGGKMLSMAATSALMLCFYTLESLIALKIINGAVILPGGIFGLLFFVLQKWLVSSAFIALILLPNLFLRNTTVGIIGGFLVATGGLTMGISLFAERFHLNFLLPAISYTISGSSQHITLTFSGLTFLHVVLTTAFWILLCCMLSKKIINSKDV
ncbi:hypothetical protein KIH86_26410 [Paenibacillus sp. HN-1]|uniref:hypothetical protein n=1 Tax=Paenibacillus TaxID=44249 RepID=UPI001CA84EE0|nr:MULTISPECIES: hypothetical protein [Paenibacillus]MBY9079339.1 hypothetical protein [Paenibacillus sp. CGMCC 1.18879]MBY9087726.1 hypothetical protein [Paenibacillus sinensis]